MSGKGRRVLVTGGAGFVGSRVAAAHLRRGDKVWVLDDLSSGRLSAVPQGAELVRADIRSRRAADLIRDVRFHVVNHHAAQVDVRASVADPQDDLSVNLAGLVNLLEAARRAGAPRVVFASSGGVLYGEADETPTPEHAPKRPLSPYGVSKLAGEHYLDCYRQVHGLECVALRYGNVYGPGQDPSGEAGVVAIFCLRILRGQPLAIYGGGEQQRDYVHVEDAAAANLIAAAAPLSDRPGIDARAFNVGTGAGTTVNSLADRLEEIAGRTQARTVMPARPGELLASTLAANRLRELGWKPSRSLREGLAGTFRHIAGAWGEAGAA